MRTLIVTLPGDSHANAVAWGLKRRGHDVVRLYPYDLSAGACWSFDEHNDQLLVRARGASEQRIDIGSLDAVWMRRVPKVIPQLHCADVQDRAAAESECEGMMTNVLHTLSHRIFSVNPAQSYIACTKLQQLAVAREVGMRAPRTLISNDRDRIAAFLQAHSGGIVYKPLKIFPWKRADQHRSFAPTTAIPDMGFFDGVDVQASPAMYQELISRAAEVRLIVMGRAVVAWSSRLPRDYTGDEADWRLLANRVVHEEVEVPAALTEQCFAFMSRFGLIFGCFDFMVTATGEWIFLEVNPAGQFLYGDELGLGLNLFATFIAFLESRNAAFDCVVRANGGTPELLIFKQSADRRSAESEEREEHAGHVLQNFRTQVSIEL